MLLQKAQAFPLRRAHAQVRGDGFVKHNGGGAQFPAAPFVGRQPVKRGRLFPLAIF